LEEEGLGNNADKSGKRQGGLALSGHPFQGISRSFYNYLPSLKIENKEANKK